MGFRRKVLVFLKKPVAILWMIISCILAGLLVLIQALPAFLVAMARDRWELWLSFDETADTLVNPVGRWAWEDKWEGWEGDY